MIEFYPVRLKSLDQHSWDSIVEEEGTAFHLSSWLKVWEESFPFLSSVFVAAENDTILGGIPFCYRERFKFKEAYSMPRGCYGGSILREGIDPEVRRQLDAEFTYWCMREKFTRINIVELSPEVNTALESYDVRPLTTHILNLEYSSEEQLNRLAKSHKRNLPKEEDDRFTQAMVRSEEGVEKYYQLITETAKRQGRKPFYLPQFYRSLLENFKDGPRLYWPMICLDGQPVSSAIVFIHRNSAIYWDGASSEEALDSGANFHLFWDLIQMLRERGIAELNFGASPKKKPGLKRFKSGWGADRFNYFEYNYQKPLDRFARKVRKLF